MQTTSARGFLVERASGELEAVHLSYLWMDMNGALVFRSSIHEEIELILAPGQWRSVIPQDSEEGLFEK